MILFIVDTSDNTIYIRSVLFVCLRNHFYRGEFPLPVYVLFDAVLELRNVEGLLDALAAEGCARETCV